MGRRYTALGFSHLRSWGRVLPARGLLGVVRRRFSTGRGLRTAQKGYRTESTQRARRCSSEGPDFRCRGEDHCFHRCGEDTTKPPSDRRDRKSTRLNSSHVSISYAVFCLKKKTITCCIPHLL